MKVKIDKKEYDVKKLPLGKYHDALEALDELPEEITQLDKVGEAEILKIFPKLLASSYDKVIKVLSIATDVPQKVLDEKAGLAEASELVVAIFKENDFELVKKNIQALGNKKK